jgi:hypothetical protein
MGHVLETGNVTLAVHVNAGRPRTLRTAAKEDTIISAVERKPRSLCDIAREMGLS